MNRFKNILYFADSPDADAAGLSRAVALADDNESRLTVMDVTAEVAIDIDLEQRYGIKLGEALRARRLEELEALTAPYAGAGTLVYTRVETGTPFVEVIRAVQRNGYDLLMKSARPTLEGLAAQLFAGDDMHLLRKCPCPVWIDRPGAVHPYRTVLAAVDPRAADSAGLNRLVMDLATSLSAREQARLEVVHAWRLEGESLLRSGRAHISALEVDALETRMIDARRASLDGLLHPYGLSSGDPNVGLVKGEAAAVIATRAAETAADLIVMGTLGRTGIPGLFIGNTAEDVLKSTCTSVLAVKPEGFVSPVTLP